MLVSPQKLTSLPVTVGGNNYDALGRCVRRTINGLTKYYLYDGERSILEYKANGDLAGRNVYWKRIDEILMRYDPTRSDGLDRK